jgi:hypothetical protein
MKRSLNATGRLRIVRDAVVAALDARPDGSVRLSVHMDPAVGGAPLVRLARDHPNARVWGTVSGLVYSHRVTLGSLGALRPGVGPLPDPALLPSNPSIRVTVVDDDGRILATTDDIPLGDRAGAMKGRMPLLPVAFRGNGDMNGRLWKLQGGPAEGGGDLCLLLHESLQELGVNQRRDFAALVIPGAVQQVVSDWFAHQAPDDEDAHPLVLAWSRKLQQLVGGDAPEGIEDAEDSEWHRLWIEFAEEGADAFAREIAALDLLHQAWGDDT